MEYMNCNTHSLIITSYPYSQGRDVSLSVSRVFEPKFLKENSVVITLHVTSGLVYIKACVN